jgi:hypothetical protein
MYYIGLDVHKLSISFCIKQADGAVVRVLWNTLKRRDFSVFGFPGRTTIRPCGTKTYPSEKMQLAGTEDGTLIYTKKDLEVQDGNSG